MMDRWGFAALDARNGNAFPFSLLFFVFVGWKTGKMFPMVSIQSKPFVFFAFPIFFLALSSSFSFSLSLSFITTGKPTPKGLGLWCCGEAVCGYWKVRWIRSNDLNSGFDVGASDHTTLRYTIHNTETEVYRILLRSNLCLEFWRYVSPGNDCNKNMWKMTFPILCRVRNPSSVNYLMTIWAPSLQFESLLNFCSRGEIASSNLRAFN